MGPPRLFRGEAHPRGSRSNSDAPWWDTRGTGDCPFAAGLPRVTMGSYNRLVQEPFISFHGLGPKREIKEGKWWSGTWLGTIAHGGRHGYTPLQQN